MRRSSGTNDAKLRRERPDHRGGLTVLANIDTELCANTAAQFTRWVVQTGALHEPFVLIDVGVQGGENQRWQALGEHLIVHGLDPIQEAIDELRRKAASSPHRQYHCLAAGRVDEARSFYVNALDPFSSSFYAAAGRPLSTEHIRDVQVRRLDGLLQDGIIPPADVVKIDVEGFEKDVFCGARELMKRALAVETETNFDISETYPQGHFCTLAQLAREGHKLVFDIAFNRIPRGSFARELDARGRTGGPFCEVGKPATVNVLFCRDLIREANEPQSYAAPPPSVEIDGLLKYLIILELYGLNDVALDTLLRFAQSLQARIDLDEAIGLLADPYCRLGGGRRRRLARALAPWWRAWRRLSPVVLGRS
jgi:FkbM family methyltransferase